jgi:hypothetical protein
MGDFLPGVDPLGFPRVSQAIFKRYIEEGSVFWIQIAEEETFLELLKLTSMITNIVAEALQTLFKVLP